MKAEAGKESPAGPAWRQSLGAGLLLGLALGCSWLARWTPLLSMRLVLIAAATVLSLLGLGFVFAGSERGSWLARLHFGLRNRFTGAAVPYFVLLVMLALGAMASGNNLLYLVVAGLLAALIVSGLASTLNLSGMVLRFRLPEELVAGEPASLHFSLGNEKSWWSSYSVMVSARSPARMAQAPEASMEPVYFPRVGARSGLRGTSAILFPRRGRYGGAHFVLSTRFPFGLIVKRRRFQASGRDSGREPEVLVYPAATPMPIAAELTQGAESREGQQRGEGSELYRIRPHQPGDSRRRVHWKATARAGALRVREYANEHAARVRLRLAVEPATPAEAAEAAISRCAGALVVLETMGCLVEFAGDNQAEGAGLYLRLAPAAQLRRRIMEYLALVDTRAPRMRQSGEPDLKEIVIG